MPDPVIRPPYPLRVKVSIFERDPNDRGIVHVSWGKAKRKGTLIFHNKQQLEDALKMRKRLMDRKVVLFDFTGQDLRGADFSNLSLNGCRFRKCNLDGADFTHSWLMGADFTRASMRGAKLPQALASNKLRVYPCGPYSPRHGDPHYPFDYFYFGPARFRSTDLTGADMSNARLVNGIFRYTKMDNANLSETNFGHSHFYAVGLSGADMKDTVISQALFRDTPISQQQLRQSIGPALSLSRHGAERLKRIRRRGLARNGGPA